MQTITIGLLGLGTVGGGVVKLLQEHVAKNRANHQRSLCP